MVTALTMLTMSFFVSVDHGNSVSCVDCVDYRDVVDYVVLQARDSQSTSGEKSGGTNVIGNY